MKLDGYSNLIKIGEGGMAHVYRGIQDSLQRPVAIKLLINDLSFDEEARHRFERESYIIARLNHGNIIHVIDRGITSDDMPYFVMEYIEGIELSTAVKVRELSHREKIDIIIQVLKALSYAHKNNVIHRDIKPDNILIDDDCNVKILDFGIAQFYEDRRKKEDKTCTGTVMGTYNYMSPEQRKSSENVTAQSDLYSVGVVMYGLFTGKLPSGRYPDPAELNKDITPELNALILKCLNTNPDDRPDSAEQLKTELLALSKGAHLNTEKKRRAEQGFTQIKSKFLLLDVLREDKYGGVFLYQQKERSNLLIIKKKSNASSGYEASNLLASLDHPNIVNTLGTSRNEQFFFLVQEYMSGGTLQDKLAFQLNWQDTLKIGQQICSAMIFAHNNRIVHGHLRPTNILFSATGEVKLTDFTLKDDISDVETAHYYYLDGEERSQSADIYAVGVILYQLFTGCLPRRRNETGFVMRKVFSKLPGDIQDLITHMLSTIPESRDPQSLQRALEVIEKHMHRKRYKSFTEKPLRDKNQESDRRKDDVDRRQPGRIGTLLAIQGVGRHHGRMNLLFAILVIVYAQYLYIFDGQEKINQSMPTVYNAVVSEFEGIVGKNVRGSNSSANRRLY
ncbi:MAG: protein kinase [Proteobacteria bacterium]|nr:protein kinase [Pseudomonadota bacterium]